MDSNENQRRICKGAVRLAIISLIPLISFIATIPIAGHGSELVSGEPVGSDAAACLVAIAGLLFSVKSSFAVNPKDLLAVICLALWGTGVSSEYNSTGLALEVVFLGLLSANVSHESREGIWNLLALSAICWISSSLYSFGLAFLLFLVPILDQLHGSQGSRPVQVCVLVTAFLLLLFHQYMILAPISSLGISVYVFEKNDAKVPEKVLAAILSVGASVLVHPLLTVFIAVFFVIKLRFDLKERFNNDDVESLIGTVLLRELVMPSPGLSRLGSISTMSNLFICIVLGMILNQCVERVIRKTIGYLLEDFGFEMVLTYLFLGLFQKTMNLTLGLWLTIIVGATNSVLYMLMLLLFRHNLRSELSASSLLLVGFMWLMFVVAWSILLPHQPKSWYDLDSEQQMAQCANQILLGEGHWSKVEYSTKFAVSKTDSFVGGEKATCRTVFPDNIDDWKQKKIMVVGDSVGRFVFYGLANRLVSNQYGFPKASFHSDIYVSENLTFRWAPYINDTLNATTLIGSADLVVVSLGLWDKLWRTKTVQQYGDTARDFLDRMNRSGKKPKIAWVEMTPTLEENLIGRNQRQNLKESDADLWRDQVRNATSVYKGDISIIPTKRITSGRTSHDGIHYDMHVYMLIAEAILRGLR